MRERMFLSVGPSRSLAFGEDEGYPVERTYVPDWVTDKVCQDILHTINCWKYASTTGELVIYIPLHWVESPRRHQYRDAQLFGWPLRLNEYATEPQVAVSIKEKPKT